jgi:cobalamin biosynthesis Co2+ chelatase CbiK
VSESTSQPPSDDELVKQLEEQLKKVKVSDLIVQTLYTVSSLGYQKLAGEDRDLAQARLAIETLRVLVPVLESELGEEAVRDFKQVTANLQLAYADAAKTPGEADEAS